MVNTSDFSKRLQKIIEYYGISASAFAERIGVQRSSISHLLSGRNKPSLDFILKVTRTFPEVNLYWILNGKGQFPDSISLPEKSTPPSTKNETASKKEIEKVIIFYKNGSFKVFEN